MSKKKGVGLLVLLFVSVWILFSTTDFVEEFKRVEMTAPVPRLDRAIRGNTWYWVATDIEINDCTKIASSGQIWRGDARDPIAGPDGRDSTNPTFRFMRKVFPTLPWGSLIGRVCPLTDVEGASCGPVTKLGSLAFRDRYTAGLDGRPLGAGRLWIWTVQYGSLPNDLSEYNVTGGLFKIDEAVPAPAGICKGTIPTPTT